MILSIIARYCLILQLATTGILVVPAASGVHLRRLSVSSSPEGPVHVWMAAPVKMVVDEPKCHYFQEDVKQCAMADG